MSGAIRTGSPGGVSQTGWTRALAALGRWSRTLQHSFLLQVGLVLYLHHQLWPWVRGAAQLPTPAYFEASLFWQAAHHAPFAKLLLGGMALLGLGWRRVDWAELRDGGWTRLFAMVPIGIFAWQLSLYDPNLLLGQAHAADRLLLVAFAAGCWVHPLFVWPFLLWLAVLLGQLHFPLPESHWHWPDKRLPYDAIVLLAAFTLARVVTRPRARTFAFLVLCLTGATYSHAAIEKMRLGPHLWSWALHNEVANIFVGAHLQAGWLGFLSHESVVKVAQVLRTLAVPIGVGTLVVELAGLLLLVHRRLLPAILLGFMGLHTMICLTTGIFFWKWILFDAALLAYVWAVRRRDGDARRPEVLPGLGPMPLVVGLSVAIMGCTRLLFFNVDFAWFDSRFTNYFEIRAQGESGRSYRIDPRLFAPYDIVFQQSRFYYVVDGPVLAGTYATVRDFELMRALETAGPDDVPALKERFGRSYFHPGYRDVFARMLGRQLDTALRRGDRHHPLHFLSPPYHFQRWRAPDTWDFQEPLVRVDVRFREWLFTGDDILEVSDRPVLAIPLVREPAAAGRDGADGSG